MTDIASLKALAEKATPGRFIGHMYIARRPCGRVSACAWDDPEYTKDTAKSVAEWIRRGCTVERVARHEGDPQPEWICKECRGKDCQRSALTALDDGRTGG